MKGPWHPQKAPPEHFLPCVSSRPPFPCCAWKPFGTRSGSCSARTRTKQLLVADWACSTDGNSLCLAAFPYCQHSSLHKGSDGETVRGVLNGPMALATASSLASCRAILMVLVSSWVTLSTVAPTCLNTHRSCGFQAGARLVSCFSLAAFIPWPCLYRFRMLQEAASLYESSSIFPSKNF